MNRRDAVIIRPLGRGELPMDDMFLGLLRTGFDGYLSGEWFNEMYGETPEVSLAAYKRDMVAIAERHGAALG